MGKTLQELRDSQDEAVHTRPACAVGDGGCS